MKDRGLETKPAATNTESAGRPGGPGPKSGVSGHLPPPAPIRSLRVRTPSLPSSEFAAAAWVTKAVLSLVTTRFLLAAGKLSASLLALLDTQPVWPAHAFVSVSPAV